MYKTVIHVEGMACSMCEAHVNDAVRAAVPVKKVKSSRKKKETVIVSEAPLDTDAVIAAIKKCGYDASPVI